MKISQLKEFRPTTFFLLKFVGLYIVGNFFYGLYITAYEPTQDPVTHWVSEQTATVLTACGWPSDVKDRPDKPTTDLNFQGKTFLAVYEGCNGINVMIIFVAFLFAFGPLNKTLLWFIPLGLLIIHFVNLARISLLFLVSVYKPDYMYFTHKYFFTAILYVIVFLLWVWWVQKLTTRKTVAV